MSRIWHNWARTASSRPAVSVAPHSARHIEFAVQQAIELGHTVKPVGTSHSFSAIAATDGIRLEPHRMRGLVDVDLEQSQVTLWAGTHLWELAGILGPLGLALENMGDVDRQTIAGAISSGTHGTGLAFGGIATRVVGATLVAGTGETITVSASENADLLPAVSLGLGALGVLVTVTLQCVPRFVLEVIEEPVSLDGVLDEFDERNRAADHFEFYWFPGTAVARTKSNWRRLGEGPERPQSPVSRFMDQEIANNALFGGLVVAGHMLPPLTPSINRLIQAVSSRREYSDWSHRVYTTRRRVRFREMEYAVPVEAVPEVMREVRRMLTARGITPSFPLEVRTAAADDLVLSTAAGRVSGYVAVHQYWRDRDPAYFVAMEEIFVAHEGRPHWGKIHSLGRAQLQARYPRFDEFLRVRDRLDPRRIFANAYLDRVLGSS